MNKKIKSESKKTNPIVIIVMAIAIIGALYYGATRWRQQQYINQLAKMYGGNAGLLGGLTGGGNGGLSEQMLKDLAKEAAKEEARQRDEDAKEAAKTPEDRFNETKSVSLSASASSLTKSMIEPELISVFGKIKPTLFSGNYMGQGNSFLVVYKVPRVVSSDDIDKLSKEFSDNGYTVGMGSVEGEAAQIVLEKDGNTLSIGYDDPTDQEIAVIYVDESANN